MKELKPPAGSRFETGAAVFTGVFLAALLVRLAHLAAFRESPFYDHLIVDAQWHDEWARRWAEGFPQGQGAGPAGADARAFFRAPLYPLWLTAMYRVFGHDLEAVRLLQAGLGAATAGMIGLAGVRWFGGRAGWIAGLLAALYGPFVYYDAELLIPNLLLFLLSAALLALSAPRTPGVLLGGALLGLAAVARPNALVLLPALLVAPALQVPLSPRRRALVTGAALLLGLVPSLLVSAVNARRESGFVAVASQGGLNFYAGNHAGATGKSLEIPELADLVSWRELVPAAERLAEEAAGRELTSGEVSSWWFRRGLDWIGGHPGDALELAGRKLYYLMNAYEIPSDRDLYYHRRGILRGLLEIFPSRALGVGIPWGLVFPCAAAAFLAFRIRPATAGPVRFLAAWILLYGASILPFFVTGRFRLGLVPPLLILAGLGLARSRATFRGRPLAAALLVFVVANSAFFGSRAVHSAAEEARRGDVLLRSGRAGDAVAALERSVAMDSTKTVSWYLLGRGYLAAGRPEMAVRAYERVFRARPEDPRVSFDFGVALLASGDAERAAWAFEQVTALDPADAAAWVNLGVAYEEEGRTERALAAYRRGIEEDPVAETGLVRYAGLLLALDRAGEAVEPLAAGARQLPGSFDLWFSLAVVRVAAGDTAAAIPALREALRLRPEHPEAGMLRRALEAPEGKPGP